MTRTLVFFALVSSLLLGACASTPPAPEPAPVDCSLLRTQIALTQEDKREGVEKRDGAWKAVVPFAVAGRYGSGMRQADAADKRLVELQERAAVEGCELAKWAAPSPS